MTTEILNPQAQVGAAPPFKAMSRPETAIPNRRNLGSLLKWSRFENYPHCKHDRGRSSLYLNYSVCQIFPDDFQEIFSSDDKKPEQADEVDDE